MQPEDVGKGSALDWLRYARSDLAYAQAPRPEGGLTETNCFLAQQAAEKSVKAVLVHLAISFPKTHNLKTLLELMPDTVAIPSEVQAAVILSDYAVSVRYPGDYEPITEDEYLAAIEHARAVFNWAESVIGGADASSSMEGNHDT